MQQPFASLRDLELLGIASDRIQTIPISARRLGLKAASGRIEPYLRKRNMPPFVVEFDPDFYDAGGMTGGAAITWIAQAPPNQPLRVMDVAVTFPVGGTVGTAGVTYALNLEDGAYGSSYGPVQQLPVNGQIAIGGYTFTISGTVNDNDEFHFSLRTDAGLALATAQIAAWIILGANGIDPKTLQDLKAAADGSIAWAKAIADGDADLDKNADATPTIREAGVRFSGQRDAWDWVRGRKGGLGP